VCVYYSSYNKNNKIYLTLITYYLISFQQKEQNTEAHTTDLFVRDIGLSKHLNI
jgi:hypothetical protein